MANMQASSRMDKLVCILSGSSGALCPSHEKERRQDRRDDSKPQSIRRIPTAYRSDGPIKTIRKMLGAAPIPNPLQKRL